LADDQDPADAAARLEAALERIANAARRPSAGSPVVDTVRIAARLDALIAQLRAALSASAGS
jgi:hypothetical protein